ncbi:hypothetical protein JKF63_02652 [Porcisia hertigi]|uniref:Uncharacterized protein n=1 Tax=Porcisia hertigi TaxID=2761500 RepID=A0A836I4C4_9TRYP|nr:hypothetical protein JKF63_02652 [Porcisia hertigi]
MPNSYVWILHSSSGYYTDELVGNALRCVHAVQCSVRAGAPDFIPSIAIFLADPSRGIQCVYSSAVPDRNHTLERVGATYPPLSDTTGLVFAPEENGGEGGRVGSGSSERTLAFAQLFRLRSSLLLQQAVLRAVEDHHRTMPSASGSADASFMNRPNDLSIAASPSAPSPSDPANMWGSLAGALLAALCYLRAHPSSAFHATNGDKTDAAVGEQPGEAALGESVSRGGVNSSPLPRSAGSVLVFSDAKAAPAPSYSAECALAMTAVTASKMGVTVSCFGEAVLPIDSAENRLVALASSLGGLCADRFSLKDLGHLLDGASAAVSLIGSQARQRRDRIASQYVVGPTMLPLVPRRERSPAEDSALDFKKVRIDNVDITTASVKRGSGHTSYLGWLCPSCMAVMHRSSAEVTGVMPSDAPTEDSGGSGTVRAVAPRCPYCSKA